MLGLEPEPGQREIHGPVSGRVDERGKPRGIARRQLASLLASGDSPNEPLVKGVRGLAQELARVATTLGHIGLVHLLLRSVTGARMLKPLEAAGRTR